MNTGRTSRAFVDRFEDDKAVLLIGDREEHAVVVPKEILPVEAREGSVLRIGISCDEGETDSARERVSRLIERLSGGEGA